MSNTNPIKCSICGQFISYADINSGKVKHMYEPDSYAGPESHDWWHSDCETDMRSKIKQLAIKGAKNV